ncbi:MAG: ferritin [Bradymonadales bacterium]|jgi:ferritin
MLQDAMYQELNKQVNEELYAAYLYLALSLHFSAENYSGFANWMRKQAAEEMEHAEKIMKYILDRGNEVKLLAIEQPTTDAKTPLECFKAAYDHEVHVTQRFYKMMELAQSIKDHASVEFMMWFIQEQVEEEASTDEIVKRLERAGNSVAGVMVLDGQLAQR